jgi:hypothetical protein
MFRAAAGEIGLNVKRDNVRAFRVRAERNERSITEFAIPVAGHAAKRPY